MRRNASALRLPIDRIFTYFLLATALILSYSTITSAQQSPTDSMTPPGIAPGAPAGSYALSGFDNVNLFSGNLNFTLPLLSIGGRGEAQTSMNLSIDSVHWRVIKEQFEGFTTYTCEYNEWNGLRPGYGPGVMLRRPSGFKPIQINFYTKTLTRLVFIAPDGTEYEFRDQLFKGEPQQRSFNPALISRGRVFFTADGSAMTFISDTNIMESNRNVDADQEPLLYGMLLMADGTQYRIEDGVVAWIRDRHGNRITFEYEVVQGFSTHRVREITDSIGRVVTVTYSTTTDVITYKGFAGASRTIKINRAFLADALVSGDVQPISQLFPEVGNQTSEYNPRVVSSVELPDLRKYQFKYNAYGELAQIELPTGGKIKYGYRPGSGVFEIGGDYQIHRRVVSREVYADGVTLEGKMLYSAAFSVLSATPENSWAEVTVEHRNGPDDALLAKDKHSFFGNPIATVFVWPSSFYSPWKQGREHDTQAYQTDGTTELRLTHQEWAQGGTIDWYSGDINDYGAPAINPRVSETVTSLEQTAPGTRLVTKQKYFYDQYNNKTAVEEFAYGTNSAPTIPMRRTETEYLTIGPVNGVDYAGFNTQSAVDSIHIRRLPKEQRVYGYTSGVRNETPDAHARFYYDEMVLLARSGISGHMNRVNTARGNLTKTERWRNVPAPASWIAASQEYDIAGNVVKAIDARTPAGVTEFFYSDRFGTPNEEARGNTAPAELGTSTSFAFATKVTNALGQESYTQFSYYTGKPVNTEDINEIVSSIYYEDVLDRATKVEMAVGTPLIRRTRFIYDDPGRSVRTQSDQNTYLDDAIIAEALYDGLGRAIETRAYETSSAFIAVKQRYDGMGRVKGVTDPFRPATETAMETTTGYDAIGRNTTVTTSDGAIVTTIYSGNTVTVRDQAKKQRRSTTDALGRLIKIEELQAHPGTGVYATTNYTYSILDNATKVEQGSQVRDYTYDSLGRLTGAINPESGTISYSYDANSNLLTKTDARGTIQYTHDVMNRIAFKDYPDSTPDVTYTYESEDVDRSNGRLTKVSASVSTTSYDEFDELGRARQTTQSTDGRNYRTRYNYDLAGNMTSQIYPSLREVTTSYDRMGRVTGLSGLKDQVTKTYASAMSYWSHGAIKQMTLGNGLVERVTFNTRLQPKEIMLGTSATDASKLKLEYGYGTTANNGNLLSQKITIGDGTPSPVVFNQSYTYDQVNRLATASETGGWNQTYSYDQYGNRAVTAGHVLDTHLTPQDLSAFNPTNNRLVMANVMYDSVGNLTKDAANRSFTYDMENRQASFNNTTATYHYDGEGRRVKKVDSTGTTIYVYNLMGQMIAEYMTAAPPPQPQTSYVTQDHLGSTRVVTDQSKAVKQRYDYLPFGEEIPATLGARSTSLGYGVTDKIKQKFTGKERDNESRLDYYGARYYSGAQGRFTSADPMPVTTESFVNPQRLNLYIYVNNNPLASQDPNGEDGEGKGGDKVISVFLEISAKDRNFVTNPMTGAKTPVPGPDWQATKNQVEESGEYKLELFGDNDVTGVSGPPNPTSGAAFEDALINSEVVLYIGHGAGDPVNGEFSPTFIQVGFDAYGSDGQIDGETGQKQPSPDSKAPVIGNFSCNSVMRSDYFNDKGSGFRVTIAVDGGRQGETNLGTLEKAAHAFVKAFASTKGSRKEKTYAGIKAAQKVLNSSKSPVDKGDKVKIYDLKTK